MLYVYPHHNELSKNCQVILLGVPLKFPTSKLMEPKKETPGGSFTFPKNKNNSLLHFFSKVKVRRPLNCSLPGWLHVSDRYDENASGTVSLPCWVSKEWAVSGN
jgi:hypothetical protein